MQRTPVRADPPSTPPSITSSSVNRRGEFGGPRQRPNPSEQVTSPSPTLQAMRTLALAESILEENRSELMSKRGLETDVLLGIKQELREFALQLDRDNWKFSKPFHSSLRL
ncbi:hypothetical protein BASA81_008337 [Batrachochytrium salamandrivorans]|nr:hypothetical protein BASA81_008337 [Batrachochytrium salamandrivorans]